MKTVHALNDRIKAIEDESPDGVIPPEVADKMPTIKRMILIQLASSRATNGEEALLIDEIKLKIRTAEDFVELEDAEFSIVFSKCDRMEGTPWPQHFHAQVMRSLKTARDRKGE